MTPSDSSNHHLSRAVFVSHASEDKEDVARPLARALIVRGFRVWYDEFVLEIGRSLRESIDEGLALSEFGVVILSPDFFRKRWTKKELNALVTRESQGEHDLILPIWHGVDRQAVAEFSPLLADRFALRSSDGIEAIADKIALAIDRSGDDAPGPPLPVLPQRPRSRSRPLTDGELTRIEWHPAVHEVWGQRRLLWICLAVPLPSSQEVVMQGIGLALAELESSAYAYDIAYGVYDGLLKVWVPTQTSRQKVLAALSKHLQGLEAHVFEVDGIVRHWVWMSRNGQGMQFPDARALQFQADPEFVNLASTGQLDGGQLDSLIQQGLMARVARPLDAIGFFVAVRGAETLLIRHKMQSELERILDSAIGIAEPALYSGRGLGDYAITGRISPLEFDRLRMDITVPVNRVVASFGGRTQTTLIAGSTSSLFRDEPAGGH